MTTCDTRGYFRKVLDDRSLVLSTGCRNALADFTSGLDNTFVGIVQTVTSKLSLRPATYWVASLSLVFRSTGEAPGGAGV